MKHHKLTKEPFMECVQNTYTHKPSTAVSDDVTENPDALVMSGMNINVDGPSYFAGKTFFNKEGARINVNDHVIFNNDIYIDRTQLLNINNVGLGASNYVTVTENAKDINRIFTDNYEGKWSDGKYTITKLKLDPSLGDMSLQCDRDTQEHQGKNICVGKMWELLRNGNPPTNNAMCNCCCTNPEPTVSPYVRVMFITSVSDAQTTLEVQAHEKKKLYKDPTRFGLINNFYAMILTKSIDTVGGKLTTYNILKNSAFDDDTTGRIEQFNNFGLNLQQPLGLRHIGTYMPEEIILLQQNKANPGQEIVMSANLKQNGKIWTEGWDDGRQKNDPRDFIWKPQRQGRGNQFILYNDEKKNYLRVLSATYTEWIHGTTDPNYATPVTLNFVVNSEYFYIEYGPYIITSKQHGGNETLSSRTATDRWRYITPYETEFVKKKGETPSDGIYKSDDLTLKSMTLEITTQT
jgi:hypothetical protein